VSFAHLSSRIVDDEEVAVSRAIGIDVHRDFCEVAIVVEGQVRSAGQIETPPAALELFAGSLAPTDRVALARVGGDRDPRSHRRGGDRPGGGRRGLRAGGPQLPAGSRSRPAAAARTIRTCVGYPVTRYRWQGFADAWTTLSAGVDQLRAALFPHNSATLGEALTRQCWPTSDRWTPSPR
jgi:hypothetical protein